MKRRVSPSIEELDKLCTPLTSGERRVFDIFNEQLSEDWEIYVQPHMNNLRPDFVLLNPEIGIAVFEVKDWDLDAMGYFMEGNGSGPPVLYGKKNSSKFRLENPVEKLQLYKQEIHDLYCPRLNSSSGIACITSGLIFPFSAKESIQKLLHSSLDQISALTWPQYYPVSGMDEVNAGDLKSIFPESCRESSKLMNPALASDLRNWLHEPEFSAEQRRPLRLNKRQAEVATSRTDSGYRRVKGPAGSGKSLALAARAANLLSEGKDVLVVTYNITILNYLKDLAARWPSVSRKGIRSDITWLNYHQWCKRICTETGCLHLYKAFWRRHFEEKEDLGGYVDLNDTLSEQLPQLVNGIIDRNPEFVTKYDAILVDEGQDMRPSWWNSLRQSLKKDGEMLLVSDTSQDVYETARSWTEEAMIGCGFKGDWLELEGSYRLPAKALPLVKDFSNSFLPEDLRILPEAVEQTDFLSELEGDCNLRWIQTSDERAQDVVLQEILNLAPLADPNPLPFADITFLCGSSEFALEVIDDLEDKNVKVVHTFNPWNHYDEKRRKVFFYKGDARVKVTTLHSFKGMETRALVIFLSGNKDSDKALAYTGLSRLKRSPSGSYLTVVSSNREYVEFGKKWPKYIEDYATSSPDLNDIEVLSKAI
jgi:hypothetical protein